MIRENLLYLNKDIHDRETVITYIADMADTVGLLSDKNLFLKSVQEREHILPTSVGFKVAIPHGRSSSVREPFVSFMKTKHEFIWDTRNNNEVDLIFLIAVPEKNENNLHLRFLSEISKKLMDSSFRERLRNADNEHEVFVMLHEINEKVMEENT